MGVNVIHKPYQATDVSQSVASLAKKGFRMTASIKHITTNITLPFPSLFLTTNIGIFLKKVKGEIPICDGENIYLSLMWDLVLLLF